MNLTDQRVVVLGGTSGIGLATAALAAAQGAEVVVVSSNPKSVDKALGELPAGVEGHVADLSDAGAVSALFALVGPFDHLVYTAGDPLALMPVDDFDMERARSFFTLRFFGALSAVSAALPHLRPGGSVVLTTGTAGERPDPGWAVPASICGAINSLVRALAVELAPVRVNAVSPGRVRSPLWAGMEEADREAMFAGIAATIPVGRAGEVEDAAEAYVYLMKQRFATGTIATVDGGSVLV
jgi:NAD(P)-dependent dehydrogenase (short-subunit alcohol dehydrogenase family)